MSFFWGNHSLCSTKLLPFSWKQKIMNTVFLLHLWEILISNCCGYSSCHLLYCNQTTLSQVWRDEIWCLPCPLPPESCYVQFFFSLSNQELIWSSQLRRQSLTCPYIPCACDSAWWRWATVRSKHIVQCLPWAGYCDQKAGSRLVLTKT